MKIAWRNFFRLLLGLIVVGALSVSFSSPTLAATCDNQYVWTMDDANISVDHPMGVMQKWSTDGTLLDSFTYNSYRRFIGDISLSSDGKHIYGITYSPNGSDSWAGSGYHDILDSYSALGPADLTQLEPSDVTLSGERIGPAEDYEDSSGAATVNTRLEASWFVDNWSNEVGYWWARGGAIVAENTMVIDRDYGSGQLLKIDLANDRSATNWVNLHDADDSLVQAGVNSGIPVAEQAVVNAWGLGGDVVLMTDGDLLVIAWNNRVDTARGHDEFSELPILVRIHSNTSDPVVDSQDTTATVVGRIDIPQRDGDTASTFAYGGARAGDHIFVGTSNGYLLRLGDIPSTSSLEPIAFDIVVDQPGRIFGGAAGSNDFTVSNASCESQSAELADTGFDAISAAGVGSVLMAIGLVAVRIRNTRTGRAQSKRR